MNLKKPGLGAAGETPHLRIPRLPHVMIEPPLPQSDTHPPTMNPASRIDHILREFYQVQGSITVQDLWTKVLQVPAEELGRNATLYSEAMLDQIQETQDRLAELGAPPELFETAARQLNGIFKVHSLQQDWMVLRNGLSKLGGLRDIAWAAWVLREFSEPEVDIQDFEALQQKIAEAEQQLAASGLSRAMRGLLERQLRQMSAAAALYPIAGAGPLADAAKKTAAEFHFSGQELKAEIEKSEAGRSVIKATWEAMNQALDIGEKAEKITKGLVQVGGFVTDVIVPLLSGPGN